MTSVRSNNISLKYQRFTTLVFKDIGIRKSEFVAKNQLLYAIIKNINIIFSFTVQGDRQTNKQRSQI